MDAEKNYHGRQNVLENLGKVSVYLREFSNPSTHFPFPGSWGYDLFTSALLGLLFSIYSKSTDDSKYHCSVKDRLTLFFQGSFSHDHEFLASFDCHSLLVPECHHLKH